MEYTYRLETAKNRQKSTPVVKVGLVLSCWKLFQNLLRKMPNEVLNCVLVYCSSFPFPRFFRSWVRCYHLPDAVFCLPSHMAINPSGSRSACRNFLGAPAVRSRASTAR